MTALVNKFYIIFFMYFFYCLAARAQKPLEVKFYVNDKEIEVGKQVIQLKNDDIIKVKFLYPEKINLTAVSVKYYKLVPKEDNKSKDPLNQQQPQTMSKYILNKGNIKEYKLNLQGVVNPVVSVPIKDIYDMNLSKISFKFTDCANSSGKKIHRNNKIYEFYMPILDTMKKAGVVK